MDFTNFDWAAYDEMPSREELLGLNIRDWFHDQYVSEVMTRWECRDPYKHSRLLTMKRWRIQPHISVWTCLPGENPPKTFNRKPPQISLEKQAREAWARCDKTKARELHALWHHPCPDPYYCPMHGTGSD
jgi:hypothetical protein